MDTSPTNNRLWKNAFAGNWGYADKVEHLTSCFWKFRKKVDALTKQIDKSLPGLTVHDVTHLDCLWDVADTIAGPDYPLNPLEAFVFGGAVLLHDSALCFEAYEGGIDGIRETVTWRDAYSYECQFDGTENEQKSRADFAALRLLHAPQAEKLGTMSWKDSEGNLLYLIEDDHLREHYGPMIGQIAASHHWDIEQVEDSFGLRTPSSEFPKSWTVDTLKIACLLRCADAGHIDAKRAPDFLLALLKRNSVSEDHWRAQNYLGRIASHPSDETSLFVTSTKRFPEKDASAWWVAYDAINLLRKELEASNHVLNRAKRDTAPKFRAERVLGADSPVALSEFVETFDWEPVDAQIHVNNIENLVQKLGGVKLYGGGDKFAIVIRELVQNARDSVKAREILEKDHVGKIRIRLSHDSGIGQYRLQVDDNGVGMSERVMLGPLLDFGTSFWASSLVASELPSLKSNKFDSVGRFGIGFFSIFMLAKTASVYSRRYDEGASETKKLHFANGLSFRPTFAKCIPNEFSTAFSTRVEITFPSEEIPDLDRIEVHDNLTGATNFYVPIGRYLAAIVAGLDAKVELEFNGASEEIHRPFPPQQENYDNWLNQLSFKDLRQNTEIDHAASSAITRLRPLRSESKTVGLAALAIEQYSGHHFLTASSVGGLLSPHNRGHQPDFIGLMDFEPNTIQRGIGDNRASQAVLDRWIEEQIDLLKTTTLDLWSAQRACYSIGNFKHDPFPLFHSLVVIDGDSFAVIERNDFTAAISDKPLVFLLSNFGQRWIETYHNYSAIQGKLVFTPIRNSIFLAADMENGKPKDRHSVMGCVERALTELGHNTSWSDLQTYQQGQFGKKQGVEVSIV